MRESKGFQEHVFSWGPYVPDVPDVPDVPYSPHRFVQKRRYFSFSDASVNMDAMRPGSWFLILFLVFIVTKLLKFTIPIGLHIDFSLVSFCRPLLQTLSQTLSIHTFSQSQVMISNALKPVVRLFIRPSVRLSGKITFVHSVGPKGPFDAAKGYSPLHALERSHSQKASGGGR